MCENVVDKNCINKEISLLKSVKSEIINSHSKQEALDKINGWLSVLEGLENVMLGQPLLKASPPLIPVPSE